jgi:hypothetical protein
MINMQKIPDPECLKSPGDNLMNKEVDHKVLSTVIITHRSYPGFCAQWEISIIRYSIPLPFLHSSGIVESTLTLSLQFSLGGGMC